MMRNKIFIAALLLALAALPTAAQDAALEVGIDEKLGAVLPADLTFIDEEGKPVTLGELIDKPTILSLVYFECPSICGPLLNSLRETIEKMELEPGRDYNTLSISFNERDTHEIAGRKRENFLKLMERETPPESWRFLTGTRENIETLTAALGYRYQRVMTGDRLDFNHPGVLMILSPKRKVMGYIRGVSFVPADVALALIEAKTGRIRQTRSSVGKRGLLSFCYTYDPVQQKRILSITRVGAFATLAFIGVFVVLVLIFKVGAAPAPRKAPQPEEK